VNFASSWAAVMYIGNALPVAASSCLSLDHFSMVSGLDVANRSLNWPVGFDVHGIEIIHSIFGLIESVVID